MSFTPFHEPSHSLAHLPRPQSPTEIPCPSEMSVTLPGFVQCPPLDSVLQRFLRSVFQRLPQPLLRTLKKNKKILPRGPPLLMRIKSSLFFRSFKIRTDHKEQRTCMPWCEKKGNYYLIFKPAGFCSSFVSPKRCSPPLICNPSPNTPKCGDQVL